MKKSSQTSINEIELEKAEDADYDYTKSPKTTTLKEGGDATATIIPKKKSGGKTAEDNWNKSRRAAN